MPRDEKGRFTKENLDLSLPHPFTILKYLIIFLIVFPWYKFFTKTDILEFFYNKVVDCPNHDCPTCKTKIVQHAQKRRNLLLVVVNLVSIEIKYVNHVKKKFVHLAI